ncbi:MAG: PAS domain-containing protein [Pseudolabrys sp.]
MKHPSTRALFAYWNERRGKRLAPEREDIDPVAIRQVLGDTFMLAADFVDEHRFRLAGTRVCALFCRELKGESFPGLWNEASHAGIVELLATMASETAGAVAGVTGYAANGARLDLEMLVLPLAHRGHARIRALGTLSPIDVPYWLGESLLGELELGVVRNLGKDVETVLQPRFASAPAGSQIRHGFIVYKGGRQPPPPTERTG